MTDEELQQYCSQNVRLKLDGKTLTGRLICGAEAQLTVRMPYAIETLARDAALGTYDRHLAGIASPERVELVELVDEPAAEEIEDEAEEDQTPG